MSVYDHILNQGGAAFPSSFGDVEFSGMTLRDYFAAQIIVGWLPGAKVEDDYVRSVARRAYQIADIMLEVRQ